MTIQLKSENLLAMWYSNRLIYLFTYLYICLFIYLIILCSLTINTHIPFQYVDISRANKGKGKFL